jgi:hypothetical protein
LNLITSDKIIIPEKTDALESFGFKFTGSAHISKTMMLNEITTLLINLHENTSREQYRSAIVSDNILSKATQSNRNETYKKLRSFYALDEKVPLFCIFRELALFDPESIPLLSVLIAWARDPLLRASTPAIFEVVEGGEVSTSSILEALLRVYPDQYSHESITTTASHIATSWTQSGHIVGKQKRIRKRVIAKPAQITLALVLGYVSGNHGDNVFKSSFCKLLDLNPVEAKSLALQAHRANLINLKAIGPIVEVTFNRYQKYWEEF